MLNRICNVKNSLPCSEKTAYPQVKKLLTMQWQNQLTTHTPAQGSMLKVTVTAAGSNYTGTAEAVYKVTKASIAKAKVTVKNPTKNNANLFDYTGKPITLTKENLIVQIGSETLAGDQYEILASTYKNNINKGTASVQIRGLGDYGGTKTVPFKIGTKGFKWFWRLMTKWNS